MRLLFFIRSSVLLLSVFMLSCADTTPWLPADITQDPADVDTAWASDNDGLQDVWSDDRCDADNEHSEDSDTDCDADESICDKGMRYLGQCVLPSLAVIGIDGWNMPNSGHFLFSESALPEDLQEITVPFSLGSSAGTDITLASASDRLILVGRDHHAFFAVWDGFRGNEVWRTTDETGGYVNLQDAVYDEQTDTYYFAALADNNLLSFDDNQMSTIPINIEGSYDSLAPARMLRIGRHLWFTLQLLNNQWQSDGGIIVSMNMDTQTMRYAPLPLANPYGRIVWNPSADARHAYIACTGNWQSRDGGVVRVDLQTLSSEIILKESQKEGTMLDGDFVDVQLLNNGNFYIVLADNRTDWDNVLLHLDTKKGVLTEVARGLNAFAPLPIAYNPVADDFFYFVDYKEKTFLVRRDVEGNEVRTEMQWGPSAITVFLQGYHPKALWEQTEEGGSL